MAKVRVYELARALQISSRLLRRLLDKMDLKVSSHLATLESRKAAQAKSQIQRKAKSGRPGGLVFVCYARNDERFALPLAQALRNRRVNVWVDQWNIRPAADWEKEIDRALARCDQLLLVLSPASVGSQEVRSEWREVLKDDKPVIPVLHKRCNIPRRLNLIQYIDFRSRDPEDRSGLERILRALRLTS